MLYDGGGAGLNANFSSGTAISVVFDPDHLGFGKDSILSITLKDGSGAQDTESYIWPGGTDLYPTDPLSMDFLLSDFAVDITDIYSIAWNYDADFANDVSFHSISVNTVPVPAAVWLLGSGLMGLIGVRRKMRK
jgi:hypothetical protein